LDSTTPADVVLVLNAGSSSLKFALYPCVGPGAWQAFGRGQIEGIGATPRMTAKGADGQMLPVPRLGATLADGRAALAMLTAWLTATYADTRIVGVGHRVVHGGPDHGSPVIVTPAILDELRQLEPLAPLHQPYNLGAIEAVAQRLPDVPQVACFDTSFHRGQPAVAELVPLPADLRKGGLQRYGFHGLSYEYIAAHLGSGASLCALRDRRSVDSSLGFTALDGLCMGTRPGALDPGVVLYLFQGLGMSVGEVESVLYRRSGLLGISGISSDMRDLLASDAASARLAIDYFVYRATREIGALTAVLGGLDAIVFTAGIGEHSAAVRRRICEAASWLGLQLDRVANDAHATCISAATSKVSAWMIPTNEELMIARHTARLLGLVGAGRPSAPG
jgi:acetate kinase